MAKEFKIDSDVPIPAPKSSSPNVPIENLQVGESILFDKELRPKVQIAASRLKQAEGKEYTVRVVDDNNCRVWRIN